MKHRVFADVKAAQVQAPFDEAKALLIALLANVKIARSNAQVIQRRQLIRSFENKTAARPPGRESNECPLGNQ